MRSRFFSDDALLRKKVRNDSDLDITPMIDVTFLLLIFFMVTSTMQSTPDIELPVAHHGRGIDRIQNVVVTVQERNGSTVLLAGDPPAPAMTMDEIVEYARQEKQSGKSGILLKASGRIPSGTIKEITQKLQALGEVRFHYAVNEQASTP